MQKIAFEDYVRLDATALAAGVRNGDFTASELVETALDRLAAVNPKINALAVLLDDHARRRARGPLSGPFAGVPFVMKDLNQGRKGVRLTNGSKAFENNLSAEDSETAVRFDAAGLITIASSTTPEFGLTVTTESRLFGKTRNPWNLDHIAGGSSGGSAAMVAAGVVPAAHATDGGGSIRVPAACCGLFGLKVSRGRTPVAVGKTEGWNGLGVSHAVTRSVRDSAALLDATAGPEPGSRTVAPPPHGSFLAALDRPHRRLRIAVQARTYAGQEVHPECARAVEDAAQLCRALGHEIIDAQPKLDVEALRSALLTIICAHTAQTLDARATELGRALSADEAEPITALMAAMGAKASAVDLIRADFACMAAAETVGRFMQDVDVILSPTLGEPPALLGTLSLDINPKDQGAAIGRFSPFTALQNQTGQPAMSVPLHWSEAGLPVGVMFAGRLGEEETLLSLAAELERARPWFDRRPSLS